MDKLCQFAGITSLFQLLYAILNSQAFKAHLDIFGYFRTLQLPLATNIGKYWKYAKEHKFETMVLREQGKGEKKDKYMGRVRVRFRE